MAQPKIHTNQSNPATYANPPLNKITIKLAYELWLYSLAIRKLQKSQEDQVSYRLSHIKRYKTALANYEDTKHYFPNIHTQKKQTLLLL